MTKLLLQLYLLFQAGFSVIRTSGVPVDITETQDGFLVACVDPAEVLLFRPGEAVSVVAWGFVEPRQVASWNGDPVVADFGNESVHVGDAVHRLPGPPEGMDVVTMDSVEYLAICIHIPGSVILLDRNGEWTFVAHLPGAKDVAAADLDGDGRVDLLASGCGTGVVLFLNRETGFERVHIGNMEAGVKRVAVYDMDGDGLPDVVGLSCAEGGAGWWKNPGNTVDPWQYQAIDSLIEGPKAISIGQGHFAIASIFSPLVVSSDSVSSYPSGFTSCCIGQNGSLVAGHRNRFLLYRRLN